MANNLQSVTPKLLAQGLMALRQQAVMPQLVNRRYEALAGQKGSSIDVPIPSAVTTLDVAPAAVAPATADSAPTSANIPLDQWKEAPFYLTDQDMMTAMQGTIPMQASEAIKSIANTVDGYILNKMKNRAFGFAGTPGTTPFATDLTAFKDALVALNRQLAPRQDRRIVLDPLAEGQAILLPNFIQAQQAGSNQTVLDGTIGHRVGCDWYMDQNVPAHVPGVPGGTPIAAGAQAAGQGTTVASGLFGGQMFQGTLNVSGMTNSTGTYAEGDVITIAGHTQTYVVTAAATASGTGTATLNIYPALQNALSGGEAITLKAARTCNLYFHRDGFAFATRPLQDSAEGLGHLITSAVDPVSGLTLRLEVSREHKRTRFSYDMLYGGAVVRPELLSQIAG